MDMLYKSVGDAVNKFKSGLKEDTFKQLLNKDGTVNKEAIEEAVKRAFPDITPRTMTRNRNDEKVIKELKETKFEELYKNLLKYKISGKDNFTTLIEKWFNRKDSEKTEPEFDTFHHEACETVIEFLKAAGYDDESCAYGKAQKVVNMTFKHLYCMDGALCLCSAKSFEYCHMALDSFTLEWLKRTKDNGQSNIKKGMVDSWSAIQNPYDNSNEEPGFQECYKKINKKGKVDEFYSYNTLVGFIRNVIPEKEYKDLTPFQAEFFIWPEIQLHMAAEALYFFDMDETKAGKVSVNQAKKQFKMESLSEKLKLVKNTVDKLLKEYSSGNSTTNNA